MEIDRKLIQNNTLDVCSDSSFICFDWNSDHKEFTRILEDVLNSHGEIWIEGKLDSNRSNRIIAKINMLEIESALILEWNENKENAMQLIAAFSALMSSYDFEIANKISQCWVGLFQENNDIDGNVNFISSKSISGESKADFEFEKFAILLGLAWGVASRLVLEAFKWSRIRTSFGKIIANHQAVAIRLAELSLNISTLKCLILDSLLKYSVLSIENFGNLALLSAELLLSIARDAMQVAGGHGFVDGLPFKRLYEQSAVIAVNLQAFEASR